MTEGLLVFIILIGAIIAYLGIVLAALTSKYRLGYAAIFTGLAIVIIFLIIGILF